MAVDSLLLRKLDQEQLVFSHFLTGWPMLALPASAVAVVAAAYAEFRSGVRWPEPLVRATIRLHLSTPSLKPSGEPGFTKTSRLHFILQAILIAEFMTSLMRTSPMIS